MRRSAVIAIAALFCAGLMSSAQATTYYISTTGADTNAGTQASPFKTIQKGINVAVAGDTIHVNAGVYQEHPSITHGGTPGAPLTIEGAAGAVIDGSFPNFTPTWTSLGAAYGGGVYTTPVPAETNCVTMDDRTLTDLWWGTTDGILSTGCRPNPLLGQYFYHPYHYERMFQYSMANIPPPQGGSGTSWPDHTIWAGVPEGWDACRGLALWIPGSGGGTLWVKVKPGNAASPIDITTHNIKIAPADVPVISIDGADHVVIKGFTIKNGYWGIKAWRSTGCIIEHCAIVPTYNGIQLAENTSGYVIRFNEIAMNYWADTSTKSRGSNVWAMSKFLLQTRSPYAADKVAVEMVNTTGNHRVHDNYVHNCGTGIRSVNNTDLAGGLPTNTNIEVDHNYVKDTYQDSFAPVCYNGTNHRWHDNLANNVLQYLRVGYYAVGPAYIYKNIFIDGPMTDQAIVHFDNTGGGMPQYYFYNNTVKVPVDDVPGYVRASMYTNNQMDNEYFVGTPNFHYYNNLFYGDRFFKTLAGGTDANWDGNYNVMAQRTTWKLSSNAAGTDVDNLVYAASRSIEANSLWTTASPGFTNVAGNDLSLVSTSPARARGTNLTTLFGALPGGYSTDAGALPFGQAMPVLPRTVDGAPSAPYLSTVSPATGLTGGGTSVTLVGSYLTGATVSFGGTAATSVVVGAAGTMLTCIAPVHAAGNVNVTVTTSAGTSNALLFNYAASSGATLNPVADSMVASNAATTNYGAFNNVQTQSTGSVTVWSILKFDLSALQGTSVSSAVLRLYKITNNTNHVISVSSAANDTWTETGVNWNNKPAKGTVQATKTAGATGWYEWTITGLANTEFGGDKILTVYVSDDTTSGIWTQWASKEHSSKPELVISTTSGGGGPAAPILSTIVPNTGPTAGGTGVTLTGVNLAGATVSFGGTAATNVVVNGGGTQITATSPAHAAGAVNVTATTAGGTSNAVTFTYGTPAPTLTSITPNTGTTAGGTAVTLAGTNLTGTTSVSFGGTAATNVVVVSSTSVTCTTPAKAAGAVNVTATTPGGTSNAVTFTYGTPAPTLTSITPNSGPIAGGTSVTLAGTNLTGTTSVSFGGTAATNVVVVSSTSVTCTTPAKAAGAVNVTATTPGGTSNAVTYTYTAGGTPFNVTLNPAADSMVFSNSAGSNYGTSNNMQTLMQWGNVWMWPIVKFDLTGITGTTVTNAKLRVYKAANTTSHVINVFSAASDSWTETGVTWTNKPAKGTSQATQTVANSGYYEWDITAFVNSQFSGDKVVSVYLTDENNLNIWSQWWSREGTTLKPELVVTGN